MTRSRRVPPPRWAGLPWGGLPWAGLPWAGLPWAGLPWAGLPWAGLPWAGLPSAALLGVALLGVALLGAAPTAARAEDVDGSADAEADAEDYEVPSVLVVARRGTPEALVDDVRELLVQAGQLVDASDYEREARSRGLPAESAEALAAILPDTLPELDLVVVVGANRPSRATLVSLVYHDRFGLEILEEEHSIRGNLMTDESRVRVLAEVRLALAVTTRPRGGLSALGGGVAPGEASASLAVHVGIEAGAGMGTREFSVPTAEGILGLDTAIFPSAAVQLSIDVEPTARGQLTLGADVEYLSSFALVTTDQRVDGTLRETSSRSQRIGASFRLVQRVEPALDTVSFAVSLGWSALSFTSEAPVSLPDYTLQGPVLALGVLLPVPGGALSFALVPEGQWIVDVGGALSALGVAQSGAAVGGSARVRVRLVDELFADLTYRESHAFLSASGGGGSDVERFVTLRAVYRP